MGENMKIINHTFTHMNSLEAFLSQHKEIDSNKTLIQFFSGIIDKELISAIISAIKTSAPKAKLIGATTYGEITNGKIYHETILISFSIFDKTHVETFYSSSDTFDSGLKLAKKLLVGNAKCLILFSEAFKTNAVPFIEGIQAENSSIVVAGGNAADNNTYSETYVIEGANIHGHGLVGAVLYSDSLNIHNDYSLNWNPFGRPFTITKTDGNKVIELNNKPIAELVDFYFGKEAVDNLPSSIVEFPLLKTVDNTYIGRSVIATDEEGFLYAGDMKVGDVVRFGVGDIQDMHSNALKKANELTKKPTEAIYCYSCAGRLAFISDDLGVEFELFNQIAPVAGFFTYGEFYHTGITNQVLNLTTTLLSISESDDLPFVEPGQAKPQKVKGQMLRSLTSFINRMTVELDENFHSLESYKDILDESTIVSKTDLNGIITYANEAFCTISGYSLEEIIGQSHKIVRHPDTSDEIYKTIWDTILAKKTWRGMMKNMSKSGKTSYLDTIVMPLMDNNDNVVEYMSIRHDMTKIIKQEQLINEQLTDNLTKLPNRVKLFNDLDNNTIKFLAILNIDGFKGINDLYGFDIADQLLIKLAAYINVKLGNNMTLYRIGGDDFVVTCSDCIGEVFKEKLINILTDIKRHIFQCGEYEVDVSLTAGLAYDTKRLLTSAEVALRNARKSGIILDIITHKSPEANIYLENTKWVKDVKEALNSNNIINYYQIIQSIKDPSETKYEALVRLRDKEGQIHSPSAFLPIIKQTTEYEKITKTVIFNVFEVCCKYDYNFTLNLSAQDIRNQSTIEYLKHIMSLNDIAGRITLEITESEALVDYSSVASFIDDFKKMGCRIAIDDFGSGYSNFVYLAQFNVDFLKIDGSIIKRVSTDKNALITLESILDFAKRLGIETIAEFVCDKDIYDKMVELGVDYVQGYYIGRPEPLK